MSWLICLWSKNTKVRQRQLRQREFLLENPGIPALEKKIVLTPLKFSKLYPDPTEFQACRTLKGCLLVHVQINKRHSIVTWDYQHYCTNRVVFNQKECHGGTLRGKRIKDRRLHLFYKIIVFDINLLRNKQVKLQDAKFTFSSLISTF